jgi:hypothetical protein
MNSIRVDSVISELMKNNKTYQLYESTPLVVAEVPECQPELQSTQSLLGRGLG